MDGFSSFLFFFYESLNATSFWIQLVNRFGVGVKSVQRKLDQEHAGYNPKTNYELLFSDLVIHAVWVDQSVDTHTHRHTHSSPPKTRSVPHIRTGINAEVICFDQLNRHLLELDSNRLQRPLCQYVSVCVWCVCLCWTYTNSKNTLMEIQASFEKNKQTQNKPTTNLRTFTNFYKVNYSIP